jgi:hypothetical protein
MTLSAVDLLQERWAAGAAMRQAATLQRSLYDCLRKAVLDGGLPPSTRLPASRDLAQALNLSRNTVKVQLNKREWPLPNVNHIMLNSFSTLVTLPGFQPNFFLAVRCFKQHMTILNADNHVVMGMSMPARFRAGREIPESHDHLIIVNLNLAHGLHSLHSDILLIYFNDEQLASVFESHCCHSHLAIP